MLFQLLLWYKNCVAPVYTFISMGMLFIFKNAESKPSSNVKESIHFTLLDLHRNLLEHRQFACERFCHGRLPWIIAVFKGIPPQQQAQD
jgi:hypothetical protein